MANANDNKILFLKNEIQKKKEELNNKNSRFTPRTSCIINFEGLNNNLNVLGENDLILLLVKLNSLYASARNLNCVNEDEVMISGFSIIDWMDDIKLKLEVMSYAKEKKNLDILESKLDKMLSEDKKIELEIEQIASMIK